MRVYTETTRNEPRTRRFFTVRLGLDRDQIQQHAVSDKSFKYISTLDYRINEYKRIRNTVILLPTSPPSRPYIIQPIVPPSTSQCVLFVYNVQSDPLLNSIVNGIWKFLPSTFKNSEKKNSFQVVKITDGYRTRYLLPTYNRHFYLNST